MNLETGLVACYAALNYQYWNTFEMSHWKIEILDQMMLIAESLYTDQPDGYNLSYSRQNASNTGFISMVYILCNNFQMQLCN